MWPPDAIVAGQRDEPTGSPWTEPPTPRAPSPPPQAPPSQPNSHRPAPQAPPVPPPEWNDGATPTAEEFARRRAARPAEPVATMGVRGALAKGTLGLLTLQPGRREQEYRHDVEMVRRNFGGLRQVTVVNPKGGAGKTVASLLLAMTF